MDGIALINAWEIRSNNEWREVSRGHSTIVVANIMGRTELFQTDELLEKILQPTNLNNA